MPSSSSLLRACSGLVATPMLSPTWKVRPTAWKGVLKASKRDWAQREGGIFAALQEDGELVAGEAGHHRVIGNAIYDAVGDVL